MVTSVTNFGKNGLYDWIVQRFSAVVLAVYTLCLAGSFVVYPDMDYQQWRSIFDSNIMRLFSLITLLCLCAHAWIGMWTISTDYLTVGLIGNKATFLRLVYQGGCVLLTLTYLLWGIQIFWGI